MNFKSLSLEFKRSKNIELQESWLKEQIQSYSKSSKNSSLSTTVNNSWLTSDIVYSTQSSTIPNNICLTTKILTGIHCIQIQSFMNIADSRYQQYLKYKDKISLSTLDTDYPQESTKRMLLLELTDGKQFFKAIEYEKINSLNNSNLFPGMKIKLTGPIPIRKGICFLANSNVCILGGKVSSLVEKNSTLTILTCQLGLKEEIDTNRQQGNDSDVTITPIDTDYIYQNATTTIPTTTPTTTTTIHTTTTIPTTTFIPNTTTIPTDINSMADKLGTPQLIDMDEDIWLDDCIEQAMQNIEYSNNNHDLTTITTPNNNRITATKTTTTTTNNNNNSSSSSNRHRETKTTLPTAINANNYLPDTDHQATTHPDADPRIQSFILKMQTKNSETSDKPITNCTNISEVLSLIEQDYTGKIKIQCTVYTVVSKLNANTDCEWELIVRIKDQTNAKLEVNLCNNVLENLIGFSGYEFKHQIEPNKSDPIQKKRGQFGFVNCQKSLKSLNSFMLLTLAPNQLRPIVEEIL